MKIQQLKTFAISLTIVTSGFSLLAITPPVNPSLTGPAVVPGQFQTVAFRDRAEADMLRRAYRILATGDHDYKGHRAKAMKAVKSAAAKLDLDLGGDDQYREKQALSDEKMREAEGLLQNVLGAAEVKDQEKIADLIHRAIKEINDGLSVR